MLSNIYSQSDSPILLSLFVQNPDLNVPQIIYGQESLARGYLREITTDISLKRFLKKQPLSPSKKWYQVIMHLERPGKEGKRPIHFWIPRDQDLKIGVLNHELMPIQNQFGIMYAKAFSESNKMCSFELIQKRLNDIFRRIQPSPTPRSSSSSSRDIGGLSLISSTGIQELPSIPSTTFASSRRFARKSPSITLPLTSFSSSSTQPCDSFSTALDPNISISAIQPSKQDVEIRQCHKIFVKEREVYKEQSIYVMLEGKLQEIAFASLRYLLQIQPRTTTGDAIECAVIFDDKTIHFHLTMQKLSIAMLDSKSMPIKDRHRRTVTNGLTHNSGKVTNEDLERIQRTLDIWPQQYRARKISSTSDPTASFRTVPPASKMRAVRTLSGQMSEIGNLSDGKSLRSHSESVSTTT